MSIVEITAAFALFTIGIGILSLLVAVFAAWVSGIRSPSKKDALADYKEGMEVGVKLVSAKAGEVVGVRSEAMSLACALMAQYKQPTIMPNKEPAHGRKTIRNPQS